MEQIYTQIRQYIDENRQPMLNLWRDLVNTESGTTQIDGVNAVCSILRREMENAASLSVKLLVDVSRGENWYDAKS